MPDNTPSHLHLVYLNSKLLELVGSSNVRRGTAMPVRWAEGLLRFSFRASRYEFVIRVASQLSKSSSQARID